MILQNPDIEKQYATAGIKGKQSMFLAFIQTSINLTQYDRPGLEITFFSSDYAKISSILLQYFLDPTFILLAPPR